MDINLEDFIESYQSVYTNHFQKLISSKKEFNELKPDIEKLKKLNRGEYYNHQIFYHRYLRIYDDLLIMDATGTGKSCSVMGFTELVTKEVDKLKNGN
jgi:hypothetical protein